MIIYYLLENNQIDDILVENNHDRYPYGLYRSDNQFYAYHLTFKASKNTIMLDLKQIFKRKHEGYEAFNIKGLSKNFLNKINEQYQLTSDYIKNNLKSEYHCKLDNSDVIAANEWVQKEIESWTKT